MKIVLPTFYEDELFYSWLVRCYIRNVFYSYQESAKYFFGNNKTRPNFEFINALMPDFIEQIKKVKDVPEIIQEHTMYPYYSRFWNVERKQKSYNELYEMKSKRENKLMLPLPKNGEKKLRYCPVCVKNDREKLGEAYWHRGHQIDGALVCHKHGCYLADSEVVITTRQKYALYSAELSIPEKAEDVVYGSEMEKKLAEYLYQLLTHKIIDAEVDLAKLLHIKMYGTKYVSKRGTMIKCTSLYRDYLDYWGKDATIRNARALKALCGGERVDPYTISQIAIMFGISVEELVEGKCPEINPAELFDERVRRLNATGMGYLDIARKMDVAPCTILQALQRMGLQRNRIKKEYRKRRPA